LGKTTVLVLRAKQVGEQIGKHIELVEAIYPSLDGLKVSEREAVIVSHADLVTRQTIHRIMPYCSPSLVGRRT
jgi:hypothetical protein